MAVKKPCSHGKYVCGALHSGRVFLSRADAVLRQHGEPWGRAAQAWAPVAAAVGEPTAGLVTGALGKAAETYAQVRNQIG